MTLLEQPSEWTELGAFEVVSGVHRIPLPLAIDGLRAVNVYVIVGPSGLTVIDSGWAGPESRKAFDSALGHLGHHVRDIEQFVVTHAHWDHYTHALALREEFGTPVWVGAGEQHSIQVRRR